MLIWKRLLKWLAWLLGGVLVLVVVAYLTLLAVNWRDRPPSQAAIRLAAMYQNRPPVADGDNAYVYVMGFAAARDEDPRAAGVRRLEWMRNIPDAAQYPLSGDPVPGNESYKAGRSAVLTTELRSRKVPVEQMPAELAASRIRVPYTGEPFAWNAEEGANVFTGLEPNERGRHAFKY